MTHKNCFYVNPKQFLTNDYREHIMTENSKYADTRLKKKKLYQLICDGNLLFQNHHLKKTREKAKYYEELWYRILVNKINLVTKLYEEKFKNSKNIIDNKIQTINKQNAVQKSYTINYSNDNTTTYKTLIKLDIYYNFSLIMLTLTLMHTMTINNLMRSIIITYNNEIYRHRLL